MRASIVCVRECVNACACDVDKQVTDGYKKRKTQTYRDCVFLHACVHVHVYITCLQVRI